MKKTIHLILTVIALTVFWEVFVKLLRVPAYIFPDPWSVFADLTQNFTFILSHTAYTTLEITLGFLLGFLLAVFLIFLSTYSEYLESVINPLLSALQTVPKVAFAPLFLIWIGYGLAPKVIIAASMAVFPIALNLKKGLDSVDQKFIDITKSFGCTKTQILKNVQLPFALPFLFSGLRIGASMAVIGAVLAEFIGASQGLGYQIMHAGIFLETPRMFSSIIMIMVIGLLLNTLISIAERRIVFWQKKPLMD